MEGSDDVVVLGTILAFAWTAYRLGLDSYLNSNQSPLKYKSEMLQLEPKCSE
jgi:hypothetical protein